MTDAEKSARAHFLTAAAVGFVVFILCAWFRFPGLNPETWGDVAAAAGLRPPARLLGGMVRAFDTVVFGLLEPLTAIRVLRLAGWATGGLVAYLAYHVLMDFCGSWIAYMGRTRRGRAVAQASLATCAIAFACSDPVWYAAQSLSAAGLRLVLALLATRVLQLFIASARRRFAFLAMGLFALLAGDTPLGILGAVACAATVFVVSHRPDAIAASSSDRLMNPLVRLVMRRFLALVFASVFIATVIAECGWFRQLNGYEAITGTGLSVSGFKAYFSEWKPYMTTGLVSTWRTWPLAFIVVVFPAVIARLLRDRSIDEEDFLPVSAIAAFSLIGVVAWSQLCGLKAAGFANWFDGCDFREPLVHAAAIFLAALTLVWTMLVLGAAFFLKNPRKVAGYKYADAAATDDGQRMLGIMNRIRRSGAPAIASLPLVILATVVPFRNERTLRGMLGAVQAYLAETVDECVGADRIFTDGFLDDGLELEAFHRGGRLWAINVMTGNGARDMALRTRGLTSEDDRRSALTGAYGLLRTWANDTPERLATTALQLGFELWRGKQVQPVYLGTVALPPTFAGPGSEGDPAARARAIGERIVELYRNGSPDREGTQMMRECLRFAQWRLSRFGQMRAGVIGQAAWTDAAAEEQRLADELRDLNSSYRAMQKIQGRGAEGKGSILTPREGLRLGLERADFKLARPFAETIIVGSPNDPEANFALGMDYFLNEEYTRADPYLKRVLEVRPDDPAVLNNLAVIQLRLYRYDEAEKYARAALDRWPNSPQIQKTLAAILKARPQRAQKAEEK